MNLKKLKEFDYVLCAVLFGSSARGDNDQHSDKDVFIICRDMSVSDLLVFKNEYIRATVSKDTNLCAYRRSDVVEMATRGSLFLWHLKLEGKVIFSKDAVFEEIIKRLQEYNGYNENFRLYLKILDDIKESYTKRQTLNEFDLGLLFSLARNTCMQICMKHGRPEFGRKNVYSKAKEILGAQLPMNEDLYYYLFGWKSWYERGIRQSESDLRFYKPDTILKSVEKLVNFGASCCLLEILQKNS